MAPTPTSPKRGKGSDAGAAPTLAVGEATGACQRLAAVHGLASPSQLVFQGLLERKRPLLEQRKPVVAKARLREAGDALRECYRFGQRPAGLDHPIDQAMALGFLGSYRAARQDQVHGQALASDPSQANRAAIDQRHAETTVKDAEDRVTGGDAQIAPERELHPSGHAVALNGPDHGLAELQVCRPHRAVAFADLWTGAFGERLQVKAGAEVAAGTGENGDAEPVIGIEAPECRRQRARTVAIDGVSSIGPIERDDHNRTSAVDVNRHADSLTTYPHLVLKLGHALKIQRSMSVLEITRSASTSSVPSKIVRTRASKKYLETFVSSA